MLSLYSRASLEALLEMLWRCVVDTDTQCPLQLPSRHLSFLQEHHSLTDPPRCIHCEGSHALSHDPQSLSTLDWFRDECPTQAGPMRSCVLGETILIL